MSRRPAAFGLGLSRPGRGSRPDARSRAARKFDLAMGVRSRAGAPSWLASAVLHAVFVAVVLAIGGLHRAAAPDEAGAARAPEPTVTMMYVPPAARPRRSAVPPRPEPARRPPPHEPPKPMPPRPPQQAPQAPAPAPAARHVVGPGPSPTEMGRTPDHDAPAPVTPRRGDADRTTPASERETRDLAMVSEARRLFGPRESARQAGAVGQLGPVARAGMPVYMAAGGKRCMVTGEPAAGGDDGGADSTDASGSDGFVEGIVRDERTGRPIPGAFMQIVGTPYVTFANASGHYRLAFDQHLVGPCRTQVVRVSASGYAARTLLLTLGRADNTVAMPRR
jgi:hypothetical protein